MAKKPANSQPAACPIPTQPGSGGVSLPAALPDEKTNLDTCLKVLGGIQEQIRFADTKAAFVFGINTLMFGFVAGSVTSLKKALTDPAIPPAAWVALVALILFGVCAVTVVGLLIFTVMSRFGKLAPRSRVFFGHIASDYGKDYGKFVSEMKAMTEDDWVCEVGTQIVETSHIAVVKHSLVRLAALISVGGLVAWVVAVFCTALIG